MSICCTTASAEKDTKPYRSLGGKNRCCAKPNPLTGMMTTSVTLYYLINYHNRHGGKGSVNYDSLQFRKRWEKVPAESRKELAQLLFSDFRRNPIHVYFVFRHLPFLLPKRVIPPLLGISPHFPSPHKSRFGPRCICSPPFPRCLRHITSRPDIIATSSTRLILATFLCARLDMDIPGIKDSLLLAPRIEATVNFLLLHS